MILFVVLSLGSVIYVLKMNNFAQVNKLFIGPIFKFELKIASGTKYQKDLVRPIENTRKKNLQLSSTNSRKEFKFSSCNLEEEAVPVKPLINTDPGRYLVAISHNGPTNQLMGLRDAIFLSIRLNRTLILPKFFKVKTESTVGGNEVPAEYRFNLESLAKLIPYKQNNELQDVCSEGVGQLVTGRGCFFVDARSNTVKAVAKSLHLPYPVKEDGTPDFICSNNKGSFRHIIEQHDASSKCIAFSFYGIGVAETPSALQEADKIMSKFENKGPRINVTSAANRLIYSLGLISTGLPSIVKKLAKKFINDFMKGGPYLAIHWRYNPNDWMVHCNTVVKKNRTKSDLGKMCYRMKHLNPEDLLHAGLAAVAKKVGRDRKITNITSIYLATPLNQKPIIKGFEQESIRLQNSRKTNLTFLTSTTLKTFLEEHEECIKDKSVVKDTLALVEMELCIQSTIFLHSVRSSWSDNVLKERRGKLYPKFGKDILSLAWEQHENSSYG